MSDPIIISYYTRGTPYEKEAEQLRLSAEKFGFEYRIEGIEPFGKWHEHTCYKPTFILQKMEELKRPVVWIDADAEIVQKPSFPFHCDMALRICDEYPADHPSYLYAGTLFFNYTVSALELVKDWSLACQKAMQENVFTVDQQMLGRQLLKSKAIIYQLPIGYTAIFEEEIPLSELYIVHYQASRLYKKVIDGEWAFGILESLNVDDLRKLRPKVY